MTLKMKSSKNCFGPFMKGKEPLNYHKRHLEAEVLETLICFLEEKKPFYIFIQCLLKYKFCMNKVGITIKIELVNYS